VFLVDTSVWIDYLRGTSTESVEKFQRILDQSQSFGITSLIYQEVLQGTDSDVSFARLDAYLRSQRFYHPQDPLMTYTEAARIYYRCRRKGITIRSTIDCLVAQIAIENDLLLLHSDRDFDDIASVVPELEIF
jgi:predicted nucleic acid-binding protein